MKVREKPVFFQVSSLALLFLGMFYVWSLIIIPKTDQIANVGEMSLGDIDSSYFAGKTIEWIIPFKEGGGSDTWARFNAQFLSKYIPGNPTILISNVPGGGSIKGTNLYAERAKPDGLMILGTSGSTQMPFLLEDPRVKYDYADFRPLMTYPTGGVVYVSPNLGISHVREIGKMRERSMIYASQGPTSLDIVPDISFELLGLSVRTVFGFRGRGAGRLAFERGEVEIDYQTSSAYLKNVVPLVQSGEAIPLWSWGTLDGEGHLVRDPSFPLLPHFGEVYEMVHQKKGAGLAFDSWFATMAAGFGGMKLLLVPKDTPDAIVDIFANAIEAMKLDEAYQANKRKAIGLYEQVTGAKAQKIFELATNIEAPERAWCKEYLRRKYDLNL